MGAARSIALVAGTALGIGLIHPIPAAPAVGIGRDPRPAEAVALAHVEEHRAELGLTARDVEGLIVTDVYRSSHSGVTHVYLGQTLRGIRVLDAAMTVNVDPAGRVVHAPGTLIADLAAAASGHGVGTTARATAAAAREVGLGRTRALERIAGPAGVERRVLLTDGGVSAGPIPARLVYVGDAGGLRLAWEIRIDDTVGRHRWLARVDAGTGELLEAADLFVRDDAMATGAAVSRPARRAGPAEAVLAGPEPTGDGASYRVYALPLESPNDGPRSLVQSPADATASPFGWHDTNGAAGPEFTVTRGNNAHAYADPNPFTIEEPLPLMDAECGATLTCDHPIDFSLPPHTWRPASITNLFYWLNVTHDVAYRYGFDEPAGNFQVNNYGHGGLESDPMIGEGQDHGLVNNAGYWSAVDGEPGVIEMFFFVNPPQPRLVDSDLDAGVVAHEYSHGISTRLTGGPSRVDCLQNGEQMGEGWSDFLALALTARPGDSGPARRGMGTYVLGESNRGGDGIRPTPYSTSMSINPSTYDTIKTNTGPHGVGYVWATMLWDLYWVFVDRYGFNADVYGDWTSGGNNLAIQLVMDGMKFQPCSPGFVDGRDAILAANAALTDGTMEGVNRCLIWNTFARRGLGVGAKQGSPTSATDGTQAFDVPGECGV